jgi:tRNA modification GTPase
MSGLAKLHSSDDTIVALSTPHGRSGIGVIRLSGPDAQALVERFFRSGEPFEDRRARYGTFHTETNDVLDRVVVTFFKAPHSYTGEDVAEISAHGNPLILNMVTSALVAGGARRADAGEFTLRALAHGKMDLAQAEAIRDFIEAQTQTQARVAMLQMDGALSKQMSPEKEALVGMIAELEAGIDFAEDEIEEPEPQRVADRITAIGRNLEKLADTFQYGRLLSDGLCLAIAGKPNVGKSSLFNRLVSNDRAIVTEIPGTTRDVLTETVAIGGVPVRFADTAGVRDVVDTVEALGVTRTLAMVAEADLTLVVLDSSRELDDDDRAVLARVEGRPHLVVINKEDLPAQWEESNGWNAVRVSALAGTGLDDLEREITAYISGGRPGDSDTFVITNERQQEGLTVAVEKLDSAAIALAERVPHEMVLLDLYAALSAIGELTGEVASDDILDRIFSTFCIGK